MVDSGPETPVVVFAYRRLAALKATLASICACDGAAGRPIIVFVDGAKGQNDRDDVKSVRDYLSALDRPHLDIRFSERNRGLRASVYNGVKEVLEQWERCIVIEDDLSLSPAALRYFDAALDRYENSENIMAACGYMYNVGQLSNCDKVLFLPFASSWGWATWRRAWADFSVDNAAYRDFFQSPSFRRRLRSPGIISGQGMLDMQMKGRLDSWAILWNVHITKLGGLCVFPPRTLVRNGGFATSGATHSSTYNPFNRAFAVMEQQSPMLETIAGLDFGNPEIDFQALDWIVGGRHTWLSRMASHLGYWRRTIQGRLMGK